MKTLFILRHAKSDWSDGSLADFDRPLNPRGLKAATFIGNYIYENDFQPDLIVSSPARRARQTAALVKETGRIECEIQFDARIYEASPHTLRQVISEAKDENASILLVGHNPGMEGLIKLFTGEELSMPTAGLAKINLEIESWRNVGTDAAARLDFLVRPKDVLKKSNVG